MNSGTSEFCRCQESGEWSPIFGCNQIPKKGQCCKVLTFSLQDKTFHFLNLYAPFLGPWVQVRKQWLRNFFLDEDVMQKNTENILLANLTECQDGLEGKNIISTFKNIKQQKSPLTCFPLLPLWPLMYIIILELSHQTSYYLDRAHKKWKAHFCETRQHKFENAFCK